MLFYRSTALLALATSTLVSAAPSLTDILAKHENLTQLNDLLTNQFPDILKTIQGQSDITFLAPSDHAFERVPYTDVIGQAFNDNDTKQISAIMDYHVVPGLHTSDSLNKNGSFQFLPTTLTDGNWSAVDGGQKIGAVLQGNAPPIVVFTSGLSTRSVVSDQDIEFEGGIIQIIDAFAVPPMPFVYTADQYNLAYTSMSVLSFTGAMYSTPANPTLAKTVNETADLTLFVPANIAMELVSGTLANMPALQLQELLAYHVLAPPSEGGSPGPLYSSDFASMNNTRFRTLQGNDVSLIYTWNSYFVNSARVVASDIQIKNGVMHVIDNVLSPNRTNLLPNPTTYTQMPVLPTSIEGGGALNSSAAPFTTFMPNFYYAAAASAAAESASTASGTAGNFGAGQFGASNTYSSSSATATKGSKSAGSSIRHVSGEARWVGAGAVVLGAVAFGGMLVL